MTDMQAVPMGGITSAIVGVGTGITNKAKDLLRLVTVFGAVFISMKIPAKGKAKIGIPVGTGVVTWLLMKLLMPKTEQEYSDDADSALTEFTERHPVLGLPVAAGQGLGDALFSVFTGNPTGPGFHRDARELAREQRTNMPGTVTDRTTRDQMYEYSRRGGQVRAGDTDDLIDAGFAAKHQDGQLVIVERWRAVACLQALSLSNYTSAVTPVECLVWATGTDILNHPWRKQYQLRSQRLVS
jgi:hypothetical protein